MRALVTGSTGFLGRHLMDALRADGRFRKVFGVSRTAQDFYAYDADSDVQVTQEALDLEDARWVKRRVRLFSPQVVFHLAADSNTRPQEGDAMLRTNVLGTHNLLEALPRGCRFVLASSATVYGDGPPDHPLPEGFFHRPTSVYGASKSAAEALCWAHQRKVSPLILRYVANAGKHATHGVVLDLCKKLAGPSEELELIGAEPGTAKPYMHADDTVSATILLALTGCRWTFNVAPADQISISAVAAAVMEGFGVTKPPRWLGETSTWEGDNPSVLVNNKRLLSTGWLPRHRTSREAVRAAAAELRGVIA